MRTGPSLVPPHRATRAAASPEPRTAADTPYQALVEADALDVLRLAPDGSLLADLPGWRRLTGRAEPMRGFDWWHDVCRDDREAIRTAGLEQAPAGRLIDVPMRVRDVDGHVHRLVARMVGLTDIDGAIIEWIGRVEDVTEEVTAREYAEMLARATAALARTVTVEDVLACVEHMLLELVDARACALFGPDIDGGYTTPLLLTAAYPDVTPTPAAGGTSLELRTGTAGLALWHLLFAGGDVPDHASPRAAFLETVAAQLAQALSRAQLLEQSRSTARLLQRALLPERLPTVRGLEVAARYRSPSGSDVGGDWYDVLQLGVDGHGGDKVALVLGDVMGRGVRAASTMGQVRNALRGIAVVDPSPVGMLAGLDRFFAAFDQDEITTVVITVLDTATGQLHVGNAGHLPPLMIRADGRIGQLDDGASTPLGLPTERVACKGTSLLPGDLLVMCSDGLIERRNWSLSDGLDVLASAARRLADSGLPIEEMADGLLREVLDGCPTDDDTSLLLARLTG